MDRRRAGALERRQIGQRIGLGARKLAADHQDWQPLPDPQRRENLFSIGARRVGHDSAFEAAPVSKVEQRESPQDRLERAQIISVVRLLGLKGRGLFHIQPQTGPVFAIQVEAGDLINVPKGTLHWFDLCADRTIRAIRLFQDKSGWVPSYTDSGIHQRYAPVCWGPSYVQGEEAGQSSFAAVIKP